MSTRKVVVSITLFALGVFAGSALHAVWADSSEVQQAGDWAWEVTAGPFGAKSFYAVKFNRQTGETWILSAERGAENDKWLLLPQERVEPK